MPQGKPTIDYASPQPTCRPPANGWIVAGAVLAAGFFVPPVAVVGVLVNWVALRRSAEPQWRDRRQTAQVSLFLSIVGLMLIPAEYSVVRSNRIKAEQFRCESQMRAIVFCLQMYANNHRGVHPPGLQAAADDGDVSPKIFICEGSGDPVPASSSSTKLPARISYTYTGRAQPVTAIKNPAKEVALYEQPNHNGGMNVAFYDGFVEFVPRGKAQRVLAELKAGNNPPPTLSGP